MIIKDRRSKKFKVFITNNNKKIKLGTFNNIKNAELVFYIVNESAIFYKDKKQLKKDFNAFIKNIKVYDN